MLHTCVCEYLCDNGLSGDQKNADKHVCSLCSLQCSKIAAAQRTLICINMLYVTREYVCDSRTASKSRVFPSSTYL